MEAFATVDQLEAGWRPLSSDEQAVAAELLDRATAQLMAMLAERGIAIDGADEVQAVNLRSAVCSMVRGSMGTGAADGIASMSQTIGGTAATVQWSNPDGGFYLSRHYRKVLGLAPGGRYRAVAARTFADEG